MRAWQGLVAQGPPEMGMALISGQESPAEMLALAWSLEANLRRFYQTLGGRRGEPELKEACGRLAAAEQAHLDKIGAALEALGGQPGAGDQQVGDTTEGGFSVEELLAPDAPAMSSASEVLQAALGIEAQALDLYFRFSAKSERGEVKELLLGLVDDEKGHLRLLGEYLDRQA